MKSLRMKVSQVIPLGFKDIGMRIFELVARTQYPWVDQSIKGNNFLIQNILKFK